MAAVAAIPPIDVAVPPVVAGRQAELSGKLLLAPIRYTQCWMVLSTLWQLAAARATGIETQGRNDARRVKLVATFQLLKIGTKVLQANAA